MESKAPFHEINKSSENKNDNNWKDYIIWESYKEIINSKEDIYIFISYNTDDFSDNKSNNNGNGIYNGHNDFYKDIIINKEKLNFYKTINGFLEENKEYQKIYTEYLINKYSNNGEISVIEELLLFTAKFVNKYDYKNNDIYIRKIIITDGKNIIDINNNEVNIEVLIEYKDTSGIAIEPGKKDKKEKQEKIIEKIETKCIFNIDVKKLKFSIDSIEGFEKSDNKNC